MSGKRQRPGLLARAITSLRAVPHLFGKVMVVWCVLGGTAASAYALRILSRTGADSGSMLVPILAFFGGELALMFGKNALSGRKNEESKKTEKESEDTTWNK